MVGRIDPESHYGDSADHHAWRRPLVYPEVVGIEAIEGCNIQMTNVTANEVFPGWQNYNGSNWNAPLAADGWGNMSWDSFTSSWILKDILYEVPYAGKTPVPWNDGTNGYSEDSSALMTQHTQVLRVGSSYNGSPTGIPANPGGPGQGDNSAAKGVLVQTNAHYHYLDHGNHGRRF